MRDVIGFEGFYKVTEDGKVWSCKRKIFLKPAGGKGNYQMVILNKSGKRHYDYVHRLVAKAYIPNPDNLPEVNHKDEVKDNNHVSNLEWCNKHYNLKYSNIGKTMYKGKPVYCVELDKTFPSILSAARAVGVAEPNLSALLRSNTLKSGTVGGYHWRYAT